jgi:alpha-tubulin suppressor-like RCC1 family protein
MLTCGASHTADVLGDGSLWTWVCGTNGQLGQGDEEKRLVPTKVQAGGQGWEGGKGGEAAKAWADGRMGGGKVKMVSGGDSYTAAVLEDGSLWTWGNGANGRLGHGDESSSSVHVRVPLRAGTKCTLVASGSCFTAALITTTNTTSPHQPALFTWGQSGADTGTFRHVKAQVSLWCVLFL